MPAAPPPAEPTPFARLLLEYMWSQRPWPLQVGQLAYKIGVSKQAVTNWTHGRRIPPPHLIGRISEVTGIPLVNLYAAAGYPVPAPPPPQLYIAERQYTPEEEWERFVTRSVQALRTAMRERGEGESSIEATIQSYVSHLRDVQYGTDRERHVAAEFAPPPAERTVPDLPAAPPSQPSQPPQRAPTTPRRSSSSTGEHQERRSPRRPSSGRVRSTSQ